MTPQQQQEAAKHAVDLVATGGTLFVSISHWAELATPIVTFLIGIATLVWWALRFWDRFAGVSND